MWGSLFCLPLVQGVLGLEKVEDPCSKLSLGVSVSVNVCLSQCGPVMDWRSVQGVPRLTPEDCCDRLQPTRDPTEGLSGRKWMDGWMDGFARVSKGLKCIFERTWSCMKAEEYRKDKKNAKQKGE